MSHLNFVSGSIDNDEIEEANSVVQRVWGDEINKPLGELIQSNYPKH